MADETFPAFVAGLSDITTLNSTDELVAVRSGVSYSTTPLEMATYVAGSGLISGGFAQMARARISTAQSISDNTPTWVAFDAESYDTDTMHDNVTNNTRLSINTTGKWQFTINCYFASNAAGYRYAALYSGGAALLAIDSKNAVNGTVTGLNLTFEGAYTASVDYFEVKVFQNSGGALNLSTCIFVARRVG